MKKLAYLALLAAVGFSAAACNTIAGMGKDLNEAGRGISNAFSN